VKAGNYGLQSFMLSNGSNAANRNPANWPANPALAEGSNGNRYVIGVVGGNLVIQAYDPLNGNVIGSPVTIVRHSSILTAGAAGAVRATGSIGDKIFRDTNGDGLDNDGAGGTGSGTGIANVTVDLYRDSNSNGVIDPAESAPLAHDLTDGNGI